MNRLAKPAVLATAAVPTKQLTVSTLRPGGAGMPNVLSVEVGDHVAYFSGGGGRGQPFLLQRLAKRCEHGPGGGGEQQLARGKAVRVEAFRRHRPASRGRVGCRGGRVSIRWPAGKLARWN
jgi:hypothetical protein